MDKIQKMLSLSNETVRGPRVKCLHNVNNVCRNTQGPAGKGRKPEARERRSDTSRVDAFEREMINLAQLDRCAPHDHRDRHTIGTVSTGQRLWLPEGAVDGIRKREVDHCGLASIEG
jgi:hypothetical protein